MSGRVTIRPATEADAAFAYAVLEATMRGHAELAWGAWDEAAVRAAVLEDARASRSSVIELDGAPAGLLRVDEFPTHLQLEQIFLSPEHQRRGLGTSIVESLQSKARGLSLQCLTSHWRTCDKAPWSMHGGN